MCVYLKEKYANADPYHDIDGEVNSLAYIHYIFVVSTQTHSKQDCNYGWWMMDDVFSSEFYIYNF